MSSKQIIDRFLTSRLQFFKVYLMQKTDGNNCIPTWWRNSEIMDKIFIFLFIWRYTAPQVPYGKQESWTVYQSLLGNLCKIFVWSTSTGFLILWSTTLFDCGIPYILNPCWAALVLVSLAYDQYCPSVHGCNFSSFSWDQTSINWCILFILALLRYVL